MICFVCKTKHFSLKSLVAHLKIFHDLRPESTYHCCEQSCSQSFGNLKSFKRHLLRKHCLLNSNINKSNEEGNVENKSNTIINENSLVIPGINTPNLEEEGLVIFNKKKIEKTIQNSAAEFITCLHNNNNFSVKDIEKIQKQIQDKILNPILNSFDNFRISESSVQSPVNLLLLEFKSIISNTFELCSTTYRLHKWLMKNDLTSNIFQFSINDEINIISHNGQPIYDECVTKGTLLPLKFQFKKTFENHNLLENYSINRQKTSNSNISSFTDGNLWKEKISIYENEICIPYFLYFDDFEINNPLGSHRQSITGIYYSFPLIDNCSKLQNIFTAGFVKALDFKTFGNDACLKYLINEINSMAIEGLIINTSEGQIRVHFILALVLGDNLGLNSICDFSKSFSSNYFCRFCKCHKSLTKLLCEEKSEYFRNKQNYEQDVIKNDSGESGILANSILNKIHLFHVVKNYSLDIMHDIFEGICHYDVCHIIKYYVNEAKIFTLDTLNLRKQYFDYGEIESGNISNSIQNIHLSKSHLKMTASEMKCFIHYFPLMIGDLIPEDDDVWMFFICLSNIIDLILSDSFNNESLSLLRILIKEHNEKYLLLFKDTLKPKHHNLIHYPTIISQSGPPKYYWSFRFEAKHRELKSYARSITSRRNITLSLAKKMQMKFSHNLLKNTKADLEIVSKNKVITKYAGKINKFFKNTDNIESYSELLFKGTKYKQFYFLSRFTNTLELFKIQEILVVSNSEIFFVCDQILLKGYDSHLVSYEVEQEKTVISKDIIINIKAFNEPPFNLCHTPNGRLMFRKKNF